MSRLETAENPQKLKRIAIDPVTRVEGHGKVTLLLDDADRIHQVRLHIVEFRGFEIFIEGRPYWEVPVTVQRLCGICPVSHHLAAVKAMDLIAGYGPLPATAEKLRRLMHYGQIVQSHAVHFFHLASPDLLLGFDSEPTRRNIVGVAQDFPEIAKQGVLLRKFGQEVIRHTAGKRIHGTGAIPGGMNKALTPAEREEIRRDVDQMIEWSLGAVHMVASLHRTKPEFYNRFGEFDSSMMGMVGDDGALDFYHGGLRAQAADGSTIFDHVDYSTYEEVLQEEAKSWSYMKFPHIRALGAEKGWYKVGPLARVQVASRLSTPLADIERKKMMALGNGKPVMGTLFYHWARLIEALHACELIRDLLDDPDILGTDLMADKGDRRGEAVGVIEAPRGTLFHHYRVDENDQVTFCNLIVSTTNNNQAMNEAIRSVALQYLDGRKVSEGLLNHIEVAIRAYDPCLSCATHALGQMPLEVDLVDASGDLIHRARRNMGAPT
ncbi:Ni/Fe hydrogenase subunit alpha [Pinisolibacter aquiterrae]|uniref:Ni/Fe hydrogenase subunit alpha n=1 Tax=Pinisolibacter aquiterrae TaxID=2815579 RepID=UPI001C3D027F|nr:Ni/Fe hydrogenase subunit alpha [Pinisolibacter aquiterrae]MBV5265615.1 Ni/Fe hydrogenase subunit alpha [Pinisolibacter aquiterrae]MCC8236820.1 Ni/Fe hydrogenase subunit alpha [Pinisolibacter aquiterrae]